MRIALVEDEKKLAETIKAGLETEGFQTDIYLDGAQAETSLTASHITYDLFIFDLSLPHKSGLDICRTLREQGIATPVLILTARNNPEDKITLLDAGADDFMTKPFDFDELLARMRALLRRPPSVLPTELGVADLKLSPNTHKVTRAHKKLSLTVKEYQLLHYLLRNLGRVVSREELFEHVWTATPDSASNILDVHVKNLRDKVDHDYAQKLIQTVRGVGYTIQK